MLDLADKRCWNDDKICLEFGMKNLECRIMRGRFWGKKGEKFGDFGFDVVG